MILATDPAELAGRGFDVIVVCVKSYDTAPAAEAVAPLVGPDTAVVSMQNGYGNVEHLTERFGADRVLCARVITGFSIPAPGQVDITVHADDIRVGSFRRPGHPAAERLTAAINDAGLPASPADNVEAILWGKILYNCALNPLGAILGVHYGALADSAHTRRIMDAVIDEAFAVIDAHGFPCLWASADAFRKAFYEQQIPPTYDHRPSMLQDLAAGKPTEIDALNGAVVRLAAEKGLPAPVNETLVRMVRFLESHGRDAH
ncbi:MAG: ketopantoate reductase family protein [Planctomycetota bacterium]|jgi:2-dehydropantoate 2-reductase